jgi:hypothetical protein
MRFIPYIPAPILSQYGGPPAWTIGIQWTDVGQPSKPIILYHIFRGDGTSPSSFLEKGTSAGLFYIDSATILYNWYTYYVIGDYADGSQTGQSNHLSLQQNMPA